MAIATATALALAASLASAGIGAYQSRKMANDQDSIAAQGIRNQAKTQREANARINETIDKTKNSTPDDERATAQEQYLAQLQRAMGQAKTGLGPRGVSGAFDEAADAAGADVSNYGGVLADLFARMDAPILQRQGEGNSFGDLGMDLSRISGNVSGDDFLTRLKMQNVKRNPWLDLVAGGLSGYAAGGGGTGAAKGATNFGVPLPGSGAIPGLGGGGYGQWWGTGRGLGLGG
jgi:hypothetical protein